MKKDKGQSQGKLPIKTEKVRNLTPVQDDKLRDVAGGAADDGAGGSGPTRRI